MVIFNSSPKRESQLFEKNFPKIYKKSPFSSISFEKKRTFSKIDKRFFEKKKIFSNSLNEFLSKPFIAWNSKKKNFILASRNDDNEDTTMKTVDEITRLLKLGEKALSKKKIHSIYRIENLVTHRVKKLQASVSNQKELTKEDVKALRTTWRETKDLIENIGQFCESFFYESQKQNYNSLGEKTNNRMQYLRCLMQA